MAIEPLTQAWGWATGVFKRARERLDLRHQLNLSEMREKEALLREKEAHLAQVTAEDRQRKAEDAKAQAEKLLERYHTRCKDLETQLQAKIQDCQEKQRIIEQFQPSSRPLDETEINILQILAQCDQMLELQLRKTLDLDQAMLRHRIELLHQRGYIKSYTQDTAGYRFSITSLGRDWLHRNGHLA
jgi:hypothetical protein